MKRLSVGLLVCAVITIGWAMAMPRHVAAVNLCNHTHVSPENLFAGNGQAATPIGSRAHIEFASEALCVQNGAAVDSWSLSWVSIDGANSAGVPGIAIWQGGIAACANIAGSCPYNNGNAYVWHFYGHEQGPCGAAFNTGVINDDNPSAGADLYKIDHLGGYYGFYKNGTLEAMRSANDIEVCWPGAALGAEWQNEMLDPGDQNGGTTGNHQSWTTVSYKNHNNAWIPMNRGNSSPIDCDANSNPSAWRCQIQSSPHDTFTEWDTRF